MEDAEEARETCPGRRYVNGYTILAGADGVLAWEGGG
jgi:hypothetical protein